MRAQLFLLLIVGFLAACSSKVTGVVYLDTNRDGIMESDEGRLVNVAVKVLDADNNIVGSARTTEQGFAVRVSGPGHYCVEVDSQSLNANPDLTLPPLKTALGKDFGTPGFTNTQPMTPSTATPPTDPYGSSGSGSTANTIAHPADAVCGDVTGLSLDLKIPVTRDYTLPFPAVSAQTHVAGEPFTVTLPHPAECTLKTLYLPDLLKLAPTTKPQPIQFDPSINAVTFLPSATATVVKAATIDVTQIWSNTLQLEVRDTAQPGEYQLRLEPKAECPGQQEIVLSTIPMTVKVQPLLTVGLNLGDAPTLGGAVKLTADVHNQSNKVYTDVTLVIAASGALMLSQVDGTCQNLGNKAECHITLPPNGFGQRTVVAQLPQHLTDSPTEFTFEASVKIDDAEDRINAEPIVFSLEDPNAKKSDKTD